MVTSFWANDFGFSQPTCERLGYPHYWCGSASVWVCGHVVVWACVVCGPVLARGLVDHSSARLSNQTINGGHDSRVIHTCSSGTKFSNGIISSAFGRGAFALEFLEDIIEQRVNGGACVGLMK